jgi:hypothetical protein
MEYCRYTSDELTHFVGASAPTDEERFQTLLRILRAGRLRASDGSRTTDEAAMLLSITGNKKISDGSAVRGVIVCFCDIPLPSLGLHMSKYGPFGIAFTRAFLVAKGANPVFYVVNDATLPGISFVPKDDGSHELARDITRADLMDRFHWEAMRISTRVHDMMFGSSDPELQNLFARIAHFHMLLYQATFAFVKSFNSAEAADSPENYYMEREWRVYGDVQFSMSDVQRIIVPRAYHDRLRQECPSYTGDLHIVDSPPIDGRDAASASRFSG